MSERTSPKEWIPYGNHDELEGDGFHISYNPDTSNIERMSFVGDEPEETALCRRIGLEVSVLILNGDWRKPYEERIDQGYEACYQFYQEQKAAHQSSWSSDHGTDEP